jgi:hypothetical protein
MRNFEFMCDKLEIQMHILYLSNKCFTDHRDGNITTVHYMQANSEGSMKNQHEYIITGTTQLHKEDK